MRRSIFTLMLAVVLACAALPQQNTPQVEAQASTPEAWHNDPASVSYWTPTPTSQMQIRSQNVTTQGGGTDCPVFDGRQTTPNPDGSCLFSDSGVNHFGLVPEGWYAYQGTGHCTFSSNSVNGSTITFYKNGEPNTAARCGVTPPWTATPTATATATPTNEVPDEACPLFGWAATHPNIPAMDGSCLLDKPTPVTGTVPTGWFALSGSPVQRYSAGQSFSATKATLYRVPPPTPTPPAQETQDGNCPLFGWAATHPNPSDGSCKLDKTVLVHGTVASGWFALSGNPQQRYEAGQTFSASKASFYGVTGGPQPGACNPRPNVALNVRNDAGTLYVTVTAGTNQYKSTNQVHSIRFKVGGTNTLVTIGQSALLQNDFTTTFPAGTRSASFIVTRSLPGPGTLPMVVTDDCGDWSTFVGIGH